MAQLIDSKKILEFLELVGRLKHVKRTGWVICDIDECESIAGHMYRMGLMTFLLTEENNPTKLDPLKCLQIALVHDLAECIVGDLTPHCGVSPDEKHRREDDAMKKIAELTGLAGDTMYRLYQEYEKQSSPEAAFAKDLDRYDMILQAFEYEKRENTPKKLQEFFTATEGKFQHPFIKELVRELYSQREEFEKKSLLNGTAAVTPDAELCGDLMRAVRIVLEAEGYTHPLVGKYPINVEDAPRAFEDLDAGAPMETQARHDPPSLATLSLGAVRAAMTTHGAEDWLPTECLCDLYRSFSLSSLLSSLIPTAPTSPTPTPTHCPHLAPGTEPEPMSFTPAEQSQLPSLAALSGGAAASAAAQNT